MRPSLARVLSAAGSSLVPEEWIDAAARISGERAAIETLLAQDPPPHVYGFTTLLGQLDSQQEEKVDQEGLLNAHLVGTERGAPAEFLALVTRCKIEQLHHGGSGIHPETYRALLPLDPAVQPSERGAWLSSYGAGDVVPAAWWLDRVVPSTVRANLRQGDLIALLNGSFYSTALGVAAAMSAVEVLGAFLRRAARLCSYAGSGRARGGALLSPGLADYFARHARSSPSNQPQLPVSLRDADVYLVPIAIAMAGVGEALERRLAVSSANPLFEVTGDGVNVQSQSGFLDVTLTYALTNLAQTIHLAMRATQRFIVHACETRIEKNGSPDARRVQPPKAAMAIVERAGLVGGQLPLQFTGSDSDGIEDLRDLSLLTGASVLELAAMARETIALLDSVVPGPSDDPEPSHALMELLTGESSLDTRALLNYFKAMRGPFLT